METDEMFNARKQVVDSEIHVLDQWVVFLMFLGVFKC